MNSRPNGTFITRAALWWIVWISFTSVHPAFAANWTVRAQPVRLVNGGPVLFQVKPPQRLESLSGKWLGHEVSFSFDPSLPTTKSST